MGTTKIFPKLLIFGLAILASSQNSFAATTASQTVTGTLGPVKQVVTNGGTIGATIDENTGSLSTALNPGFRVTTNTTSALNMRLSSTCNYDGGTYPNSAFFGNGGVGTTYILLTNNTVLPSLAAVNDAKSGAPTPAANANVIVYAITPPTSGLTYTWNNGNQNWDATVSAKGNTDTSITIPAAAPKTDTFSIADDSGSYQATITLSFV